MGESLMNVIAMMSFVGLALVAFFVAFFIHQTNSGSGAEQDALMPLDEETARAARQPGLGDGGASKAPGTIAAISNHPVSTPRATSSEQ